VRGCLQHGRTLDELDAVLKALVPVAAAAATHELPPAEVFTISGYYATWIAVQVPKVRKALARDYHRHFERYILPILGDLPISDLRPKDVRALQSKLLARKHVHTGKPLSVKTVKNIIIIGSLRAMIREAMADELVTRDVFVGLTWPERDLPEPDPFSMDEVRRILGWFATKRFRFAAVAGSMGIRRLPHPAFHGYVHILFMAGLRPSEASGLQWQDVDLQRGLIYVRRSYHLYGYNPPKTRSARRTVELLPETVRVLRALQPLHVAPDTLVFTTTGGKPIEPKTFSEHWYKCLRALGLRARGLYCTKDTYVSTALQAVRDPRWVEKQTGVAPSTLKTHYEKWMPDATRDELHQLARAFGAGDVGRVQDVDPKIADVDPSVKIPLRNPMRGGGLEPLWRPAKRLISLCRERPRPPGTAYDRPWLLPPVTIALRSIRAATRRATRLSDLAPRL
jgi:integrase